jgi:hypothetical protein
LIELDQHLLGLVYPFSHSRIFTVKHRIKAPSSNDISDKALFKDYYRSSELDVGGPGTILVLPPPKTLLPEFEMNHHAV